MTDLPKTTAPERRALDAEGISTLEDLAQRTRHQVRVLHGIGKTGMQRFDEALAAAGLAWQPETEETLALRKVKTRTKGEPCRVSGDNTESG